MLLNCKNIEKSYKTKGDNVLHVLKNISLSIQETSYIALQGASGAGKSTLLHILGGLDAPDSGEVNYNDGKNDYDLYKLNDNEIADFRNRNIGFIFQFHHLLPEFSALENVMLPKLIAGENQKVAYAKAMELMELTGISDRAAHRPNELSGGEQQRIAIARALIQQPKILLADEPTGNLDETNTIKFLELLSKLRIEYNLTCLIATHSSLVANYADSIINMKDGKIIE
jgi:ABC-type lipoprotein export system ATPase subunit